MHGVLEEHAETVMKLVAEAHGFLEKQKPLGRVGGREGGVGMLHQTEDTLERICREYVHRRFFSGVVKGPMECIALC